MSIVAALILLSVLVLAHEAGHFFAARLCGIRVQEFSVGMGPLIIGKKAKSGIQYSLRLLPLGGFCQFVDEDSSSDREDGFSNQPVWKRAITVACGPIMNFVVALVAVIILLNGLGVYTPIARVYEVEENAEQAGLCVGDIFVDEDGMQITDTTWITTRIEESKGGPVTLSVLREGSIYEMTITPFFDEAYGRYRLGFTFDQERVRVPIGQSISAGIRYCIQCANVIVETVREMIFTGRGVDNVTGPVGTIYVIQEVAQGGGMDVYLELAALISVNLGIMNLLPIPGLDGSRLIFQLIEAIRRKPVKRELEGIIHLSGFVLLMGIMLVLTYRDILQIFIK